MIPSISSRSSPERKVIASGPRSLRAQGLSAEEAKDKKKVLAARMKQLELSGLVDCNEEAARWGQGGAGSGGRFQALPPRVPRGHWCVLHTGSL